MVKSRNLVPFKEVLAEDLKDPAFRAEWERTALARAVALAVLGYRIKHKLTQTALARRLGVRQPHVARLEMGEHTPSLEMLQRLSRRLGLRFIIDVAPTARRSSVRALKLPAGMRLVEDVAAHGSQVRVAAGEGKARDRSRNGAALARGPSR